MVIPLLDNVSCNVHSLTAHCPVSQIPERRKNYHQPQKRGLEQELTETDRRRLHSHCLAVSNESLSAFDLGHDRPFGRSFNLCKYLLYISICTDILHGLKERPNGQSYPKSNALTKYKPTMTKGTTVRHPRRRHHTHGVIPIPTSYYSRCHRRECWNWKPGHECHDSRVTTRASARVDEGEGAFTCGGIRLIRAKPI